MAFQFLDHREFIEMRLYGDISGASEPAIDWLDRVSACGRLLIDASDVAAITADVLWMAAVVDRARASGPFWTAVFAPSDLVFGVLRQVSAYRRHDAQDVNFFRERTAAEDWLRSREGLPAA
ncbi:MAG: hypothetical protein AMXMBFR80_23170 [Dehalococcoidia bacterium]